MGGTGFEPVKALPSDLQSDPFDHSGNPPFLRRLPTLVAGHQPYPVAPNGSYIGPIFGRNPRGFRYELAEGLEPTTC